MTDGRIVLITGATGKQGGAVAHHLAGKGFAIRAMTRKPDSDAARALANGDVEGACMIDGNQLQFTNEGTLPAGGTRIIGQTAPYDHCNMTVFDDAPADLVERLTSLLLGMSWDDPEVRHLLELEGLKKWLPARVGGYAPLNRAVGDAWMRGDLQVFEEHLYTELLKSSLRIAINAFPRQAGSPRVLLTTLPNEQHGLGLLMVEALLAPEGAYCISLGPQTPQDDIRRAALAHGVDVVALSFSAAFPLRQATDSLASLRRHLPAQIALWAGGEATRRVRRTLPGVLLLPDLASSINALRGWRTLHPGS